MSGIGLCNFEDCSKKDTCFRYKNDAQGTEYMEFKNICNLETNYIWYWEKDLVPTTVEENKEN